MDTKDVYQTIIAFGAVIVAGRSAMLALETYRFNARTKSAEFLMPLHKAFFVEKEYKVVRDVIDDDSAESAAEVQRYLEEEPAEFTDFLNFFELITFLAKEKTLTRRQVEALLGYYLDELSRDPGLRGYIMEEGKGFEHLASFLRFRERKQNERRHLNG